VQDHRDKKKKNNNLLYDIPGIDWQNITDCIRCVSSFFLLCTYYNSYTCAIHKHSGFVS